MEFNIEVTDIRGQKAKHFRLTYANRSLVMCELIILDNYTCENKKKLLDSFIENVRQALTIEDG